VKSLTAENSSAVKMSSIKSWLGFGYGSRVVVKVGVEHRDYATRRTFYPFQ